MIQIPISINKIKRKITFLFVSQPISYSGRLHWIGRQRSMTTTNSVTERMRKELGDNHVSWLWITFAWQHNRLDVEQICVGSFSMGVLYVCITVISTAKVRSSLLLFIGLMWYLKHQIVATGRELVSCIKHYQQRTALHCVPKEFRQKSKKKTFWEHFVSRFWLGSLNDSTTHPCQPRSTASSDVNVEF